MEQALKKSMEKLINMAQDAGADSCDIILSKGNSFSLSAQNEKIDKYQVSGSQVMGLRVIKDEKVGLAYSESMEEDALKQIAGAAVENAKNGEVNPYEKIEIAGGEKIHKCEYKKDQSTTEEKINFCLSLEKEVKQRESKVQAVPYNGLSESESASYYLNSNGTFTFEDEYYQSCYTSALINDGPENSMHYHSAMARDLKSLDKEKCISESLEHAREWLKAGPLRTAEYDVVFSPDMFKSVFGCFSNIFSGKAAMEKTNPFADRLGEQVMSDVITIKDIPQYHESFFKSYVDSEGIPHADLTMVENGVLKSFYHNTATASFFNTKSTGHGSRGAKSPLHVSGTTKVISAGITNGSQFNTGEYFEILALQGLHSGANAISGEFSFGATGYFVKNGERVRPIKGVTVSGNFHKMLKDVKILGDKVLPNTSYSFFAPAFRFESISIAGN